MSTFEDIVNMKLNSYIEDKSKSIFEYKFILSVSGGVDSMALFQYLNDLGLHFYTIHFNHNHHAQSNEISVFIKDLMKNSHSQRHFIISLDLSDANNFESEARDKRYSHLENLRRRLNCDFILTGHHLDDQIETLYMRKIQNAHWSNSLGIREQMNSIRRPFLSISKKKIIAFAKEKKMRWKEDPTNIDNSFMRNKSRNVDLPELLTHYPKYAAGLLCQRENDAIRYEKIIRKIKNTDFNYKTYKFGLSIDFDKYSTFDKVGKKLIIQNFIQGNFVCKSVQYSFRKWENLFIYVTSTKKRSSPFRLSDKISIYRGDSEIYIVLNEALISDEIHITDNCIWFDGRISVSNVQDFENFVDKSIASLPDNFLYKVRQWKTSDAYISATSGHKCKVSDLFINNKLNYIQKKIQPIVTDINDSILWIPGLAHASIKSTQKFKKYSWESI